MNPSTTINILIAVYNCFFFFYNGKRQIKEAEGEKKIRESGILTELGRCSRWCFRFDIREAGLSADIIRFGLVCKAWNSKALIHKQKSVPLINHQPPWLVINPLHKNSRKKWYPSSYGIVGGSEILINYSECEFELRIPYEYKHRTCSGSSYGWLHYEEHRNRVVILFNPISGTSVLLPPVFPRLKLKRWYAAPFVDYRLSRSLPPVLDPDMPPR